VDAQNYFTLQGEKELEGGIYFVLNKDKQILFEFFIVEQQFSLETDTLDYTAHMKVKGSLENEIYNNFNKFFSASRKKSVALEARLKKNQNNADSTKIIKELIEKAGKELQTYMEDVIKKYPDCLLTKIFLINKPIDIPDAPDPKDTTFALRYHQKHYFDYTDFSDPRLLRTPVLHTKIYNYLDRLVYPIPDSLKIAAEMICEKSRANKEVFRYVVSNLTYYYESSKYMGMDAVFVHLADKYYLKGEAWWADTAIVNKIQDRVNKIKPTLIGEKAYNVNFVDTTLAKIYSLYGVKADYTLVFLFDPGCGHCKTVTAELMENYDTLKSLGAEVYAICTQPEIDKWKKFIRERKLKWINVGPTSNEYRDYYDVYLTPIIYLLDKEKRIVAKKIDVTQVKEIIRREKKKKADKG